MVKHLCINTVMVEIQATMILFTLRHVRLHDCFTELYMITPVTVQPTSLNYIYVHACVLCQCEYSVIIRKIFSR